MAVRFHPRAGSSSRQNTVETLRPALRDRLHSVAEGCTECGACVAECLFLQSYGAPKKIAAAFAPEHGGQPAMPFECSLCGLCAAFCPERLDPAAMFLEMRREAADRGRGTFGEHRGLLGYERAGTSRRYSWYGLPAGCDTVFFPGCTLPGSRPEQTMKIYEQLLREIPALGVVLDCCTKPSHDLGREAYFRAMFGELKGYLLANGVGTVLVACPNCHQVFREYAPELTVSTIYEALAASAMTPAGSISGAMMVHDPCVMRHAEPVRAAVRVLATRMGLTLEEIPHSGRTTLCCGEGGAAGALAPHFAAAWGERCREEAASRRLVTYCAGCAHQLGALVPTSHIVDILFEPEAAMTGRARVSRAPFTYLNRLRLKSRFRKCVPAAACRERSFSAEGDGGKKGMLRSLVILALVIGAFAAVRGSGVTCYLEQDTLRSLIQGYGVLAPLVYMLVYTLAPVLFLPGLPITIVGGILFGPFWGVVYTITGATFGACLAFLVARYMARELIEAKLTGSRWQKLDRQVEEQGWKVVAVTRLIPLFPFNLLNYAFGLTRIRFSHYALATFFCMLPACIAFIVFSSSLLDLLRGKVSPTSVIGLALVVIVSLMPLGYRRCNPRKKRAAPAGSGQSGM